jgi:hypothetical protein
MALNPTRCRDGKLLSQIDRVRNPPWTNGNFVRLKILCRLEDSGMSTAKDFPHACDDTTVPDLPTAPASYA